MLAQTQRTNDLSVSVGCSGCEIGHLSVAVKTCLPRAVCAIAVLLAAVAPSGLAATSTNLLASPLPTPGLTDAGPSLLRVLGALALVLGLFLGGAWVIRNGRFSGLGRKSSARLNVLETRSLGARQAICVVAYGQERFLIGTTPAGINLISHLAPATEPENDVAVSDKNLPTFSQALSQVLRGAKLTSNRRGNS